jgi:hypothetical protein
VTGLYVLIAAAVLLAAAAFIAFFQAFSRKEPADLSDRAQLLRSSRFVYEADISSGAKWIAEQSWRELEITSPDGVKLRGRWLENPRARGPKKAALLFHGYRSMPHNDFSLTARWFYERGYSVFLAELRAHGRSEGKWICFGPGSASTAGSGRKRLAAFWNRNLSWSFAASPWGRPPSCSPPGWGFLKR